MKLRATKQTVQREAPDSSVRPANPTRKQWADARRTAKQVGGLPAYQRANTRTLAALLSAFGGRVTAVETNTQATA